MKRNVLSSPRLFELKKKRRKVFLNKILFLLFVLLLIFSSLAYLSRLSSLNIQELEIIGNKFSNIETIKMTVEKEIAGNYLWFFPKTNLLFYPKNTIQEELYQKFAGIKDINFSIKDGKILEVRLIEREALYTWCGATSPENNSTDQKCYFMDENGFIFDEAPYFSGDVYFKFYGVADVGTYFLKENLKRLIYFKDILLGMGLQPVSLFSSGHGDIKIFLSSTQAEKPFIIFKIDSDLENVAENLETAISTEPLQSNFKNKFSSLEYIDLRLGNKVYYKFK